MSRKLCAVAIGLIGFFSLATVARAADAGASRTAPARTTTTARATVNHQELAMHPWRASETLGLQVNNAEGQKLGKIEDIVFNPDNGHIRYAVLSFGGFLGVGEKWFAIPWKHLRPEAKTGTTGSRSFVMVLDVDKSKLKTAPGFDSKNWPDFGNQAYGQSVNAFYGDNATAARPSTTKK